MTEPQPLTELSAVRYISLATFRRDGTEVPTPVWFCEIDGSLYCFSAGDAGKVKRIRNNGRGRIAECTMNGRITGAWQAVTASLVTDSAQIEKVYSELRRKYGWQMHIADILARISGRYTRRAVIELRQS